MIIMQLIVVVDMTSTPPPVQPPRVHGSPSAWQEHSAQQRLEGHFQRSEECKGSEGRSDSLFFQAAEL